MPYHPPPRTHTPNTPPKHPPPNTHTEPPPPNTPPEHNMAPNLNRDPFTILA